MSSADQKVVAKTQADTDGDDEMMYVPDPQSVAEAEMRRRNGLRPGPIRAIKRPRSEVMAEHEARMPKCASCGAILTDRRRKWCQKCAPKPNKAQTPTRARTSDRTCQNCGQPLTRSHQ